MRPRTRVAMAVLATTIAGCGGGGEGRQASVATTAIGAGTVTAPAPRLAAARCAWLRGFRCATLSVPLHRRGPQRADGRRLTLRVAVQRVPRGPGGDLVVLTGGPGQPGRPFGPRMVQHLGSAARGRRLVLIDQRGTGSDPVRCPALQRTVGTSDLTTPPHAAVLSCARTMGTARDAYATADTVADLDALRLALGDRRWLLLGISYGTFVAERYALAHPAAVRGLVLDSVVPEQGAELLERVPMRATARVLHAVCRDPGARCAGDPAADLAALTAHDPELGARLLDAITELSIGRPRLAIVPPALRAARRGDPRPLRRLLAAVRRGQQAPAYILSQGLHAATLCADGPAPWGGPAAPEARRAAALARLRTTLPATDTAPFPPATALRQGLLVTCRWWPPQPAPPAPGRGPIAAPALLLNGDRDLSTPLEWAREQARAMPHAKLVVVPGAGHSVLSRAAGAAGRAPLRAFLAALPPG